MGIIMSMLLAPARLFTRRQLVCVLSALALALTAYATQAAGASSSQTSSYIIGGKTYQALPATTTPPAGAVSKSAPGNTDTQTRLKDERGLVGVSHHKVVTLGASESQIQAILRDAAIQPTQILSSPPSGMIFIQFASMTQAVQAFDLLKTRLPDAQVSLPIQYSKPVLK